MKGGANRNFHGAITARPSWELGVGSWELALGARCSVLESRDTIGANISIDLPGTTNSPFLACPLDIARNLFERLLR